MKNTQNGNKNKHETNKNKNSLWISYAPPVCFSMTDWLLGPESEGGNGGKETLPQHVVQIGCLLLLVWRNVDEEGDFFSDTVSLKFHRAAKVETECV